MKIRQAILEKDYKEIAELHLHSYLAGAKELVSEKYLRQQTLDNFLNRWQARISNKNLLTIVAENDGKILGFATLVLTEDPSKKEDPLLNFFYVHIDYFRKKVGTTLAVEVANRLISLGYNSISGMALKNSLQVNQFYSSLGAIVKESKEIWLPYGTTPQDNPDGTSVEVNNYVVTDLKNALLLFNLPKTEILVSPQIKNEQDTKKSLITSTGLSFFSEPVTKIVTESSNREALNL